MNKRQKTTPEDEINILNPEAHWLDIVSAMRAISFDKLTEYEHVIYEYTKHPDWSVRGDAMSLLLSHWKREDLMEEAFAMLQDESEDVQNHVADGICIWYGYCVRKNKLSKYMDQAITEVIHAALRAEDSAVRNSLYRNTLSMIKRDTLGHVRESNFHRNVDWELIDPYIKDHSLKVRHTH